MAFSKSIEEMVKDYDSVNNYGERGKFEDNLGYVDSKIISGGKIDIKIPDGELEHFGNSLAYIDAKIKDARFKSLFYKADHLDNIVGFDKDKRIGVVDIESSTSPLKGFINGFGIRMESGKCSSYVRVYKTRDTALEVKKLKNYKISGITDLIEIGDVNEYDRFYEIANNVSCSFFNSFKDYTSASTSVVLEYKSEFIEVGK